jgi:hypothetical protein
MPKITFLLAICLAALSLSDTALASHNGRDECIALCLYQFKQQMPTCETVERYKQQVCRANTIEREADCEKNCYFRHPDVSLRIGEPTPHLASSPD